MSNKKYNILLITTDQQRYDTVGDLMPDYMRMPHTQYLINQGISYTNAYAQCPLCVPARISIMNGKYPQTTGATTNCETIDIMGHRDTLPALMRDAGYQTIAIGKMHFGPARCKHGFDEMIIPDDYYEEMRRSGQMLQPMRHGIGQNEPYPTMSTVPESMTLTSWTTEKCVEYIHERRDPEQPFFMWCSYSKPHPPFDPPEPYYSMYRGEDIAEPVCGDWADDENAPLAFKRLRQMWGYDTISPKIRKEIKSAYYGLLTQVDYNMGRIFAALQDFDMLKDTIILFTSDHGEYLGDHHTAAKFFLHQASAHVPFVLRLPEPLLSQYGGTKQEAPVTHADILPTLVKLAGGEVPEDVDGQDLMAVIEGKEEPREYLEMVTQMGLLECIGITDGKYKYIWYLEDQKEQLFDLIEDPEELTDLAYFTRYEAIKEKLKQELIDSPHSQKIGYSKEGKLATIDPRGEDERNRRAHPWLGFHTEYCKEDVKH
ncbi:MAG: sulfatase-like hydrolase/transferase [Niameybacter sp.]|uniref:sulfatase-like hydrolase/transferase n=1 Tax=Niameybacter sp. TaxID=2033640 RepID=UPI002FC9B992